MPTTTTGSTTCSSAISGCRRNHSCARSRIRRLWTTPPRSRCAPTSLSPAPAYASSRTPSGSSNAPGPKSSRPSLRRASSTTLARSKPAAMARTYAVAVDSARDIENLLYEYAERIDAGDLDGVADLFTHGRINGQEGGPPETVFEGRDRVRELYGMATRIYDDTGTPEDQAPDDQRADRGRRGRRHGDRAHQLPGHPGHRRAAAAGDHHRALPRHVPPDRRRVVVRQPHHVRRPDRRPEPAPEVLRPMSLRPRPEVEPP